MQRPGAGRLMRRYLYDKGMDADTVNQLATRADQISSMKSPAQRKAAIQGFAKYIVERAIIGFGLYEGYRNLR